MVKPAWLVVLSVFVVSLSAAAETPAIDIPRLDGVTIDGKADDWGNRGYRVEMMTEENGRFLPADDFDVAFRLGWDQRGLLMIFFVKDNVYTEYPNDEELWKMDSVEIFVTRGPGEPDLAQVIYAPGLDEKFPELRGHFYDHRHTQELTEKIKEISFEGARTRTEHGYVLEVRMPWRNLDLSPRAGLPLGVQIYVNDADNAEKDLSVKWYPRGGTHADTTAMHLVQLAEKPSPPALAAVTGYWRHFREPRVKVTAGHGLIGKNVEVLAGRKRLGRETLAEDAGRAAAEVALPVPAAGAGYPALDVLIGGAQAARLTLPDAGKERARALIDEKFRCESFFFSEPRLPAADFTEPMRGEALIGPYKVQTVCYDNEYNQVTAAEKPGRYGAAIEFIPQKGRPVTRYLTVFRTPDRPRGWELWRYDIKASLEFPEWLGIRPDVVEKRAKDLSDYIKWELADSTTRNPGSAQVLVALYEQSQGLNPDLPEDPETRDRQWWVGLKRKLYGMDKAYPEPFVCPRPIEGRPAPVLREGSVAEAGMKPDAVEKIDAVCREWAADSDQAFAVCIARHGVVFFHKAYGLRDGAPMTVTNQSWMASITKIISGSLMMMFVDQGRVDLDDPAAKFLPHLGGFDIATPLTIRHLYTHTCGLWGHWGDDLHDLEHRIAGYYPYLEIGKRFEYNGAGFAVGGKVMEMVSGDSIPVLYQKHLLGPLGCEHTEITGTSGDANSIPLDIAKIAQMLLNKGAYGDLRFFSEETFQKMLPGRLTKVLGPDTTDPTEYGIGTSPFRGEGLGENTFGHGAASAATLRIDPDNDLVVVMTRNEGGENYGKYHPLFMRAIAEGLGE